ncbi:DSBA-like thioredoxin domain protein [Ferrovum sp. JA12]|uniref:DsbA family protein n=1 Tax=Ferrovum sp. JA12 TaxID=1356299 RepID=UPI000703757C|nr:DsbA family protein [Ferrovum sp. JA12]KRH78340.1 DSBA-like thioredoxin domain protein [Ferrovum sp. JA12]
MTQRHLIYFADPMCSWCWGFSPVIDAIQSQFGATLPIKLILGGLRPGTDKAMDSADKNDIRSHWEHVHEASQQPFDFSFFSREGFIYNTEPAARSVVTLRRYRADLALEALKSIHRAFYAHNQDVTDLQVLTHIASSLGMDKESFQESFLSESIKEETWSDFSLSQYSGITGFPTLAAGFHQDQPYTLITHGFQPASSVLAMITTWMNALEEQH